MFRAAMIQTMAERMCAHSRFRIATEASRMTIQAFIRLTATFTMAYGHPAPRAMAMPVHSRMTAIVG